MKLQDLMEILDPFLRPLLFKRSVPPRWKTEPTDVSVERNRHVTLHCQADGVPIPVVIWKKATGESPPSFPDPFISNIIGTPSLRSKFTLLKSKFFPAKIPFSKLQKKNLAGKNLLCKGTRSNKIS